MKKLLRFVVASIAIAMAVVNPALGQGFGPNFFWPDGVVTYHIIVQDRDGFRAPGDQASNSSLCILTRPNGSNACENQANVILEAIERLERATPLEFQPNAGPCPVGGVRWDCLEFVVQLNSDGDGGFTNTPAGATGGPNRVNVSTIGPGVTTHEIIHALGFRHQFARADARDYIRVYEACAPAIAGQLDSPAGTRAEHRRLYGPGEFGGFLQSNSSVPSSAISTLPHVPTLDAILNDPRDWPSSIMAYSTHKAQSPTQSCFKICTGTFVNGICEKDDEGNDIVAQVRRPWDAEASIKNEWRDWSCSAGYNTPGMPARVKGCADDPEALANCQSCRASTAFGKDGGRLAMAFELIVPDNQDDERIYFDENRRTFTWLDRSKITRRVQESLVNDIVAFDREASNGRYTELRKPPGGTTVSAGTPGAESAGTPLVSSRVPAQRPSGRTTIFQPLIGGIDVVAVGHMNNDYYSDIVNYEPSSGTLSVRLTTNQPSVRSLPISTKMTKGYSHVALGWFETGTRPTDDDLFDSEQDIFAYNKNNGKAEIGRLEFNADLRNWRYETICTATLASGYDRVIAGNFDRENWNTSLAMVQGLGTAQSRVDILAPIGTSNCLIKKGQHFISGGPWTQVTGLDQKLFGCDRVKNSDRSQCNNDEQDTEGDQLTDLLFYNRTSGKAKLMLRTDSDAINFSAAAQPTALPPGFTQIVSLDYNNDSRGDLVALHRPDQKIRRFRGTPTGFASAGNVPLTTPNFDMFHLFTGHFPNKRRPSTEKVCGNALREAGEICDMDQFENAGVCKRNETPICAPDCLSVTCKFTPPI